MRSSPAAKYLSPTIVTAVDLNNGVVVALSNEPLCTTIIVSSSEAVPLAVKFGTSGSVAIAADLSDAQGIEFGRIPCQRYGGGGQGSENTGTITHVAVRSIGATQDAVINQVQ